MNNSISDKPAIKTLVELCYLNGIKQVIISPGSRNAPLVLSFTGYQKFECLVVVDERSAGYFGLGLARETGRPVALVCTSGTAALNYAPAVAEAYYQQVPLVVITADRPTEWINQGDGQTINQPGIFNNFTRHQCTLPSRVTDADDDWYVNRVVNEALWKCTGIVPGPVHINVPLAEPLYGKTTHPAGNTRKIDISKCEANVSLEAINKLANEIERYDRVMILVGASRHHAALEKSLEALASKGVVVLTETLSNANGANFINNIDRIVSTFNENEHAIFAPDLLITLDLPVLSRMVKELLRQSKPKHHWHISNDNHITDTYRALSRVINGNPHVMLENLACILTPRDKRFIDTWKTRAAYSLERHQQFMNSIPWSDLKLFKILSESIKLPVNIHLGNSTPVRYAELFNWLPGHKYYSNRGTSGIDGCLSSAAGAAHAAELPVVLIIGDLSFFYDSNGLWHNYLKPDFRVIVINNGGGGIFRFIQGPAETDKLEEFFEARHNYNCKGIANTFGLDYQACHNEADLGKTLEIINRKTGKPAIMEIFTPGAENGKILKKYFRFLKNEL